VKISSGTISWLMMHDKGAIMGLVSTHFVTLLHKWTCFKSQPQKFLNEKKPVVTLY